VTNLETLVRQYAADLRKNASGGDDYPWAFATGVADYLEVLIGRAARPAQEPASYYRHKKRGSIVREVARGFAQVAVHPIEEMTAVVIYQHVGDGVWWVRNAVEFDDGRFEPLPLTGEQGDR